MTLRHRVSTPTWCPEHGRMSGSGLRDMSGMCLKSDLTKSIGKLCDSLYRGPKSERIIDRPPFIACA